jgi:hypothetical protein
VPGIELLPNGVLDLAANRGATEPLALLSDTVEARHDPTADDLPLLLAKHRRHLDHRPSHWRGAVDGLHVANAMAELDAAGVALYSDRRTDLPRRSMDQHNGHEVRYRNGSKVVRVGTHALKAGSHASLWRRLSQHRGVTATERGNDRGSIFQLLVGTAIMNRGRVGRACIMGCRK